MLEKDGQSNKTFMAIAMGTNPCCAAASGLAFFSRFLSNLASGRKAQAA